MPLIFTTFLQSGTSLVSVSFFFNASSSSLLSLGPFCWSKPQNQLYAFLKHPGSSWFSSLTGRNNTLVMKCKHGPLHAPEDLCDWGHSMFNTAALIYGRIYMETFQYKAVYSQLAWKKSDFLHVEKEPFAEDTCTFHSLETRFWYWRSKPCCKA